MIRIRHGRYRVSRLDLDHYWDRRPSKCTEAMYRFRIERQTIEPVIVRLFGMCDLTRRKNRVEYGGEAMGRYLSAEDSESVVAIMDGLRFELATVVYRGGRGPATKEIPGFPHVRTIGYGTVGKEYVIRLQRDGSRPAPRIYFSGVDEWSDLPPFYQHPSDWQFMAPATIVTAEGFPETAPSIIDVSEEIGRYP